MPAVNVLILGKLENLVQNKIFLCLTEDILQGTISL